MSAVRNLSPGSEPVLSGLADVFVCVACAVIAKVIQGQIEMQNRIDRMQSRF